MIETGPFPVANPSERERVRRIAELLCKAIMQEEAKRAVAAPATEPATDMPDRRPAFLDKDDNTEDERVLNYLRFVGSAAPVSIRGTLGLSRTGTYRVLFRLARAGRIVGVGRTRTLAYRLNDAEPPAEKIMLN